MRPTCWHAAPRGARVVERGKRSHSGRIPLHAGAERRYRERTTRSLELLEQPASSIPTGHSGGMWYQLPYPILIERGKGSRVWDVDDENESATFGWRLGPHKQCYPHKACVRLTAFVATFGCARGRL